MPLETISTAKNVLCISTPEVTAMDLLLYPHRSGGLNHIATILAELHEKICPQKLSHLLEIQSELAWKQRLGYLLSLLNINELAMVIEDYLNKQNRIDYIPLIPEIPLQKEAQKKSNMENYRKY